MKAQVVWLSLLLGLASAWAAHPADLAVVMDDIGYNRALGLRAVHLPGPVTIAVLPFAPHTSDLAERASQRGHDVIVHQPMQPHALNRAGMEHDTLTLEMTAAEFNAALDRALDAVPQRIGVSNHTGSLLTEQPTAMRRLMRNLHARGLYFLDSRTTAATVALNTALDTGLAATRRDVFLDHDPNPAKVHQAFERALTIAHRRGAAVLVAHPYEVSLDYLERRLTQLPEGVRLVPALNIALNRQAAFALRARQGSPHISLGQ